MFAGQSIIFVANFWWAFEVLIVLDGSLQSDYVIDKAWLFVSFDQTFCMTGEFSPVWAGGGGWSCHWRSYWGSGCSWTTWRGWLMLMMVVMIDDNDGCDVMAKFPTWWLNDEDTDDEDGDGVTIMVNISPRFILFKKSMSIQVYIFSQSRFTWPSLWRAKSWALTWPLTSPQNQLPSI